MSDMSFLDRCLLVPDNLWGSGENKVRKGKTRTHNISIFKGSLLAGRGALFKNPMNWTDHIGKFYKIRLKISLCRKSVWIFATLDFRNFGSLAVGQTDVLHAFLGRGCLSQFSAVTSTMDPQSLEEVRHCFNVYYPELTIGIRDRPRREYLEPQVTVR